MGHNAHQAGNAVRLFLDEHGFKNKVRARTTTNPFGGADKVFVTILDATKDVIAHEDALKQIGVDCGFSVKFDGTGIVYDSDKGGRHGSF